MDASSFRKLYPSEYQQKFLRMNVRPDGRRLMRVRSTQITRGSVKSAYGSAFAQLGDTSVVVAVKGEVGAPPLVSIERQQQIVVNVELKPMCSPLFESGKPGELAQSVGHRLNEMLRGPAGFVDAANLCIEEGKMMWYLYADIYCLNFDGNIFDACLVGLVAALKDVRLPVARYSEDPTSGVPEVRVSGPRDLCLALRYTPVPLTFLMFDGDFIIADPTADEEALSEAEMTIVMNEAKRLCSVYKPGGKPVGQKDMKVCMAAMLDRLEDVLSLYGTL